MILLDTDVLMIDQYFTRDPNYARNKERLDRLQKEGVEVGVSGQTLLELVGNLSFVTSASKIAGLADAITLNYGLTVIPTPLAFPNYASITIADVINPMASKMSLGDAVLAVPIALFAPHADALLTWNAKHFRGKVVVPVLTPAEWLNLQPPPSATP